ncbi:hypothetical protein MKZ38_003321 [Zalerion maritima]|uniref:Beta-lactamase-related domain-containing protein n=1 Tax=Zalerion maritima TaxID=339359 RepID=A0AAD5RN39_9PEZI|nr:hypothetical protein MKZ38_003321 [Zalerion maritima]
MKPQNATPLLVALGCGASTPKRGVSTAVEDIIRETMEKYHTPGAAIAVVSGNETWSQGFGYSDIEKNRTVDTSTLFFIGSTTKSHTAASLSILVDQGLLGWESRIRDLLDDDFEIMDDDWATNHLTVTDFLSHRTGIPRYDLAIKTDELENIRSLRYLPLSAEPRTAWQYSNHNYGVAGYLVEALTGQSLEDFMTENLWKPMGMKRTYLNRRDVEGLATSYSWNNDTEVSEPRDAPDLAGMEGAGAMVSNVEDFARYLRVMMNLTEGPISADGFGAILGNHMLLSNASEPGIFTGAAWYGLGWNGGVLDGVLTYNHGGDLGQFGSYMWMFPEIQTGFVIMTNQKGSFVEEVGDRIAYAILGIAEEDQVDVEVLANKSDLEREYLVENCVALSYPALAGSPPGAEVSGGLGRYTGIFGHPAFGNITLDVHCPSGNGSDPGSQVTAENSPANPTFDDDGCVLRTGHFDTPDGGYAAELQYVGSLSDDEGGEAWMAWVYALGREEYYRPKYCMMVVFSFSEDENVVALAANARLVPGTDMFVFNRTTGNGNGDGSAGSLSGEEEVRRNTSGASSLISDGSTSGGVASLVVGAVSVTLTLLGVLL